MNSIVVISYFLAASVSGTLLGVPHITTTQYHSQDELGQYSYGYSGGPSAKQETRTADGITRGSYSYLDANGVVQSAFYVSDPVNGFRVSATNIPRAPVGPSFVPGVPTVVTAPSFVPAAPAVVTASPGFDHVNGVPFETPEVIAAKSAHFAAHGEALARLGGRYKRSLTSPATNAYSAPGSTTVVSGPTGRSFSYSTVAATPVTISPTVSYSAIAPASTTVITEPVAADRALYYSTVAAAPNPYALTSSIVAAPVVTTYSAPSPVKTGVPLGSQYRVHDDFGQYSYGYFDGLSSKTESRSADGTTHGGYSYLDSNGIVQSVKYIADGAGFRVHATNLPVGPSA